MFMDKPKPQQFALLDEGQRSYLRNICVIAAERYEDNRATFAAMIDTKPDPNSMMQIHGAGAKRIADQFQAQAEQARAFILALDGFED